MHSRLPALVLVVTALSIAGCGGSGKASSSSSSASSTDAGSTGAGTASTAATAPASPTIASGTPLSRSRLIAKADAICQRLSAELSASPTISTKQELIAAASRRTALEQAALAELSKLTPPGSMAHDYQQLLAGRQTVIEDLKKLGEDTATGNTRAEDAVYASSASVIRQMAATAQRNGFKYCAKLG
jgi:hypothetical protein